MRFTIVLAVMLSCAVVFAPASAQVLFQDDFESGMSQWTTISGKTPMDWDSTKNAEPVGGSYSAKADLSSDGIYHFLSEKTLTSFRASWWVYDDTLPRAYGEVRSFSGGAYGLGLEQIFAAGKYNSVTMAGEVWKANKYQGRILYPSAGMGWFNLDGPGSPNRSPGWHKFTITASETGYVEFYVDGILSRTISGATPKGVNCVCLGFATSSSVNGDAWFDGVLVENGRNILTLNATEDSLFVQPGDPVQVKMDISDLTQKVNSCQAMLGYSSTYLYASSSCVAPGGGFWDQLIYNSWDVGVGVPGEIDTAIGVNAWGAVGTDEDGTVALLTLTTTGVEGQTAMQFRPDRFPDPFLTGTTLLGDMSGNPVFPFTVGSQLITIDGTPPSLSIVSAKQGTDELLVSLGSAIPAVQGLVEILVTAGDAYGLPAMPAVNVYDADLTPIPCVSYEQIPYGSGQYYYRYNIPAEAANGLAQIRVSVFDKAGNRSDALDHFMINKNQISGQVECEGFTGLGTGNKRVVTFTATGGVATATWNQELTFSSSMASYTLTDVPEGTTGLSAKTAWSLRKKLPMILSDGQGLADFTGDSKLLSGDINGTNSINIQDYSIMLSKWAAVPPNPEGYEVADINGDGAVSVPDYNLMKGNWFKLGDPE